MFRCGAPQIKRGVQWQPRSFDASKFYARNDTSYIRTFNPFEQLPSEDNKNPTAYFSAPSAVTSARPSCIGIELDTPTETRMDSALFDETSILAALWRRVEAEWKLETAWKGDDKAVGKGGKQ